MQATNARRLARPAQEPDDAKAALTLLNFDVSGGNSDIALFSPAPTPAMNISQPLPSPGTGQSTVSSEGDVGESTVSFIDHPFMITHGINTYLILASALDNGRLPCPDL
jgi:hypothetical protein